VIGKSQKPPQPAKKQTGRTGRRETGARRTTRAEPVENGVFDQLPKDSETAARTAEVNPVEGQQSLAGKAAVEAQPGDYGLYRCQRCGKLVLGFSQTEHNRQVHGGENQEYEKIR
jgi:hypothetical protein